MSTGRARILYIEDNSDNRILVKRVLEAEGYTLLEAANAHEGLRQVLMARTATSASSARARKAKTFFTTGFYCLGGQGSCAVP